MFPPVEREIGGIRLSEVLRGVLSQRLIPRKDNGGRIVAVEALVATPDVRTILRDTERLGALRVVMSEGAGHGMQTFGQHAAKLHEAGEISAEAATALGE
jgi:twitching motility protein PilT